MGLDYWFLVNLFPYNRPSPRAYCSDHLFFDSNLFTSLLHSSLEICHLRGKKERKKRKPPWQTEKKKSKGGDSSAPAPPISSFPPSNLSHPHNPVCLDGFLSLDLHGGVVPC
jgi:hypothetical protein